MNSGKHILNLVSAPVAYINRDLTHQFVNNAYANWIGKDVQDILGKTLTEILGEDVLGKMNRSIEVVLSGELAIFQLEQLIDRKLLILNVAFNPDINSIQEVVGYSIHITFTESAGSSEPQLSLSESQGKERTEDLLNNIEALRRSEDRYHRMVSEVEDYAIILLDKDGNIENWNKGAERIKKYTSEEVVGKNFRIFYTKEDQINQLPDHLLREAREHGKALHEGWRIRKDGTVFWGSVVITALYNDNSEIIGFSKVTRDLTERKANEEALKKKNIELEKKNQELSTFAYVSSHDLQEPLRKIQAFTSRILDIEAGNLTQKGLDYFNRLQTAVVRMRTLIEDLLSYSGIDETERKFELTDLGELVSEVSADLKEVIESKKATVEHNALPKVNVIPFQFVQLIANLMTNALKFSRKDVAPHITIEADIVMGNQVQSPTADANKAYHHISFSDNGIGFLPEYRLKIFEVFQRLHHRKDYDGTGVGLAICKKIVDSHSGIITAEGKLNEGATFHIYLPL